MRATEVIVASQARSEARKRWNRSVLVGIVFAAALGLQQASGAEAIDISCTLRSTAPGSVYNFPACGGPYTPNCWDRTGFIAYGAAIRPYDAFQYRYTPTVNQIYFNTWNDNQWHIATHQPINYAANWRWSPYVNRYDPASAGAGDIGMYSYSCV